MKGLKKDLKAKIQAVQQLVGPAEEVLDIEAIDRKGRSTRTQVPGLIEDPMDEMSEMPAMKSVEYEVEDKRGRRDRGMVPELEVIEIEATPASGGGAMRKYEEMLKRRKSTGATEGDAQVEALKAILRSLKPSR